MTFITNLTQEDQQKVKERIDVIVYALENIKSERETIKEVLNELNETYNLDKKVIRKVAKAILTQSFYQENQTNEAFAEAYETLVGGSNGSEENGND